MILAQRGETMSRLTANQIEIIEMFAKCNMNVSETARKLYKHRNTVVHQLNRIRESTGLNPENFYDLVELVKEVDTLNYLRILEGNIENLKEDLLKTIDDYKEKLNNLSLADNQSALRSENS